MKKKKEKNTFILGWSLCLLVLFITIIFGISSSIQDTMAASTCPLAAPFEVDGVCCPASPIWWAPYNKTITDNKGITYCYNKYFAEDNGNYICRSEKLDKCSDLSEFNGYNCNEVTNEDGSKSFYMETRLIVPSCAAFATAKVTTYNTTFNANGGTINGESTKKDSCIVDSGSDSCTINNLENPTRDGYVFNGWSEDKNAKSGVTDKITLNKDNTTYYATWKEQVWVNGKLIIDGSSEDIGCYSVDEKNCNIDVASPSKEGYEFNGWARSSTNNCPGTKGSLEMKYNSNIQNNTFYACWTHKATSNLDAGDGEFGNGDSSIEINCTITTPNASCNVDVSKITPTKEGYDFNGWGDNCSKTTVTIKGNETIKACWSVKEEKPLSSSTSSESGSSSSNSTKEKPSSDSNPLIPSSEENITVNPATGQILIFIIWIIGIISIIYSFWYFMKTKKKLKKYKLIIE